LPVPDLPNTPLDRSTSRSRFSVILTLSLRPEHLIDLGLAGGGDRREVLRHGLHRLDLLLALLHDEQRAEVHRAEGGRALVDGGQERIGHVGRLLGDHRVGAVERHIGDHAEEAGAAASCDDVAAHGQILETLVAVELDFQPLGQRATDDDAELIGAFSDGAERGAFLGGGGEGVEFGVGS
jgi:hypothetical protein